MKVPNNLLGKSSKLVKIFGLCCKKALRSVVKTKLGNKVWSFLSAQENFLTSKNLKGVQWFVIPCRAHLICLNGVCAEGECWTGKPLKNCETGKKCVNKRCKLKCSKPHSSCPEVSAKSSAFWSKLFFKPVVCMPQKY